MLVSTVMELQPVHACRGRDGTRSRLGWPRCDVTSPRSPRPRGARRASRRQRSSGRPRVQEHGLERVGAAHAHRHAGLMGRAAQMGHEYDVVEPEQDGIDVRFVLEHIEGGTADHAVVERPGQRRLVHDGPAARIDEDCLRFHAREHRRVEQVSRRGGQWRVDADDVAGGDELSERDLSGFPRAGRRGGGPSASPVRRPTRPPRPMRPNPTQPNCRPAGERPSMNPGDSVQGIRARMSRSPSTTRRSTASMIVIASFRGGPRQTSGV